MGDEVSLMWRCKKLTSGNDVSKRVIGAIECMKHMVNKEILLVVCEGTSGA